MAYGDDQPWGNFEYTEYLFRLDDLLDEYHEAFAIAHSDPDDPRAEKADAMWRRRRRDVEETALEFAAYVARLRMGAAE